MRKMKTHKPHNEGFTLVETIVSFVIFVICTGIALTLLVSASGSLHKSAQTVDSKSIGDSIYDFVSAELTYATNIEVLPNGSAREPKYANVLKVQSGRLYKNGRDLYGEGFYTGKQIHLTVQRKNGYQLELKLEVSTEGETVYTTGRTTKIINLAANDGTVECDSANPYIDGIISYDSAKTPGNDLLDQSNGMYEAMRRTEQRWIELGNSADRTAAGFTSWPNNSNFRNVILEHEYGSKLPEFPAKIIQNNGIAVSTSDPVYIQAYITNPTKEDSSVIVYAGSRIGDYWYTRIVYDYEEEKWYYSNSTVDQPPMRGSGLMLVNLTWEDCKALIHGPLWHEVDLTV